MTRFNQEDEARYVCAAETLLTRLWSGEMSVCDPWACILGARRMLAELRMWGGDAYELLTLGMEQALAREFHGEPL